MIKISNQSRQPVAILENAYRICYVKPTNEIWKASFSLPLDDPKNAECQPLHYVEISDDLTAEYIGLFRIIPSLTVRNESNHEVTYNCEHVFATLLDDVIFGLHITEAMSTTATIQSLLAKQDVLHWRLGTVAAERYFSYKWENENVISALLSITKPFDIPLRWTFDTKTYPWTLNLEVWPAEPACEIRYAKNMRGIERDYDPTVVVNRWYALGYGEGVNQLNITKVNPTGKPYVEDVESIAKYGLIADFFVDRSIENDGLLYETVKAVLTESKYPKVSYRVSVGDLYGISKEDIDKIREGRIARIVDPDFGTFNAPIVSEEKTDIIAQPYDLNVEIANKRDLFGSEVDSETRRRVNELAAQGATNIDSHDYNDNADPSNPAIIRFYLPEEMVRVNKLDLTFETTAFRTYGRATKGGGGTTATSSSGGGVSTSTASGGGSTQTSSSGGGVNVTSGSVDFDGVTLRTGIPEGSVTPPYELHEHLVIIADSQLAHEHTVSIPNHMHSVSVPTHAHDFTIPNHSHSVTIPTHTHDIEHGIFKLSQLPSSVTIKVDGNTVTHTSTSGDNIDLIPYLAVDSGGKIVRGWHTVEITPNDLGRITAQITTQFFIQSRGGGNY
jgi:phage minor structural protein